MPKLEPHQQQEARKRLAATAISALALFGGARGISEFLPRIQPPNMATKWGVTVRNRLSVSTKALGKLDPLELLDQITQGQHLVQTDSRGAVS